MLIVVAWGVVQIGQRRASFSDALSLVLAKRRPRCRTCCRVPLSASCAAPNPTSSYLPQAGHPVSAVIKYRATAACSRTSGSLDEPKTYFIFCFFSALPAQWRNEGEGDRSPRIPPAWSRRRSCPPRGRRRRGPSTAHHRSISSRTRASRSVEGTRLPGGAVRKAQCGRRGSAGK